MAMGKSSSAAASPVALADIPSEIMQLCMEGAEEYSPDIPWEVVCGVTSVETDHGRLQAPGVTSGVNSFGCCAGIAQFSLVLPGGSLGPGRLSANETNPSTWGGFSVDGNGDGWKDVYDPQDAIPSAARYLQHGSTHARNNSCPGVTVGGYGPEVKRGLFGYNRACWYVQKVLEKADSYRGTLAAFPTSGGASPKGHYQNGLLPESALVPIGGGHKLWPSAAEAFLRMRAAALADGVAITVSDSYRPLKDQISCVAEKGLYSHGGLCARPGTSNHGWGLAVDVGGGPQRAWLRTNGHRFGFKTIPREPWHWEYVIS